MNTQPQTTPALDLDEVMTVLDRLYNMHGKLHAPMRAAIFTALDNPTHDNWVFARSAFIVPRKTLWQAVNDIEPLSADQTPTQARIWEALRAVTASIA